MSLELITNFFRLYLIAIYTYLFANKIIDKKLKNSKNFIILVLEIFIVVIFCLYMENNLEIPYIIIWMDLFISILFFYNNKIDFLYALLIITISISINYIFLFISISISFIFYKFTNINNDIVSVFIIYVLYIIIEKYFIKIKKFEKGIIFLKNKLRDDYFNILLINISMVILFSVIIVSNYNIITSAPVITWLIISSIIMFITIQKSLQLYYKQKMLVKDLEETKEELEEKNNKIKELEKEIIKSGKRSHSISHRQKILEHKLEELNMKSEISEMDIKSRIEKIGKDIRKEPVIVLAKTGIVEIDDVLNYMKSECLKKKIDFQLQLSGNIYKMINNYVSKDELEILLADHIKNAIIAIEHSENINKSILVRLGRLDGTYGLYVYDSGIDFEIETFLKLGKKPATTHKDSGGTGMGFMNTFDTLRKHNASFIIEEYGKPVTDNFTKVLKFKFDNKNEFKICTYRKEEIEKQDKEKILKVENLMF